MTSIRLLRHCTLSTFNGESVDKEIGGSESDIDMIRERIGGGQEVEDNTKEKLDPFS